MLKFTSAITSVGIERVNSKVIRSAIIEQGLKKFKIKELITQDFKETNVKPLYTKNEIITTAIEGSDTLVRSLYFPLTKDKDIAEALSFQAEPILPYSVEDALLGYQLLEKNSEGSNVTLFSVKGKSLESHLKLFEEFSIDPEKISSVPYGLTIFSANFLPNIKKLLILYLEENALTCCLVQEGKLVASFSQKEGLSSILDAQKELAIQTLPQTLLDWQDTLQDKDSVLFQAIARLSKTITRMGFSLTKELKGPEPIEGILSVGDVVQYNGLSELLTESLAIPQLDCNSIDGYTSQDLRRYGLPIGLAIGSLPNQTNPIDFRQGEHVYSNPWKRLKIPALCYFLAIALLSLSIFFFTQKYISHQKVILKQEFINLLADMNKSYEQFERNYQTKISGSKQLYEGKISTIQSLTMEEMDDRLSYLQSELKATPDSFPLLPNTPRVSDVLAWLSSHDAVYVEGEDGHPEDRLQIESFNYTMVKRPQHGKKQEKYQVKIDLEFTSLTPKWAREFHDALIAPNDWVDPKSEVKWSANRGTYKTSFFLKDKTIYPSL